MGYTTDFTGLGFWSEPPLGEEHKSFLRMFNVTRHVCYDMEGILPGPTRSQVIPLVGPDMWHVLQDDLIRPGFPHASLTGQHLPALLYNQPPEGVPSLWCGWTVDDQGHIVWDGAEKFYKYVRWLEFLIDTYLRPWGYTLHGIIDYKGESAEDFGRIIVVDNEVTVVHHLRGE
jgi:hypothetical protein